MREHGRTVMSNPLAGTRRQHADPVCSQMFVEVRANKIRTRLQKRAIILGKYRGGLVIRQGYECRRSLSQVM